jgi:high affinity sulfate transporter 1
MPALSRLAPGLATLLNYRLADAPSDIRAGLAVAAVALPVGIAYAELAGLPPQVGLYSSILPLLAYALFGSSRQLIVGPDAATCALIAAAIAPLALGDPVRYASLSATLAFLTGVLCIGASFLRLGALADFLSRPILVGFLNGVALSVILGQAGKIFGFPVSSSGILPRLNEIAGKLGQTHLPTLAIAMGTLAVVLLGPRIVRSVPGALLGMAAAAAAVSLFGLTDTGIKILGPVPAGLPGLVLPSINPAELPHLLAVAGGLALVSFSSLILTARSFAAKNRYEIDPDQEFAALGAANVASALSHGFAISGADSRTAMSDSAGGRTNAAGLVAAAAVAFVIVFLTEPIQYVPIAALGAVLIVAALSLVDLESLRLFYRIDPVEAGFSVLATLGVVAIGAINAILFVVVLALLRFIKMVSRPRVDILGEVEGLPGLHAVARHRTARQWPGLLLFRFNAPITFFNAPHFKQKLLQAVDGAGPELRHVVIDLLPIGSIDATGLLTLRELSDAFKARGISLNFAGRATEWRLWAEPRGIDVAAIRIFPTLRQALRELAPSGAASAPAEELPVRGT